MRFYSEVLLSELGPDATVVPESFEMPEGEGKWRFEFLCELTSKDGKERVYRAVFRDRPGIPKETPTPHLQEITDPGSSLLFRLRAERMRKEFGDSTLRAAFRSILSESFSGPAGTRPSRRRGKFIGDPIREVDARPPR